MIQKIHRGLLLIAKAVAGTALCLMTVIAFIDSIGRIFGHPLLGADEYVRLALLTFFSASIALVVETDGQIRVGLFTDLYSPRLQRIEAYFTAAVELAALAFFAWMIFDQASRLARFRSMTAYLEIPMAPWAFAAALLTALAIWFGAWNLWHVHRTPGPHPHAIPDKDI